MARNDLLTDTEREYLEDPDGFDRANSTIRKMNHDLRKKMQAAKRDARLIGRFLSGESIPEPTNGTLPNPGGHGGDDWYYPPEDTENRHTLLTPTEREFIMEPEKYAENHAEPTVAVMESNIRKKYENWEDDRGLLWETHEVWDRIAMTMHADARCIGCGRREEGEVACWDGLEYKERFIDWFEDYGPSSDVLPGMDLAYGFCPDCSHIHKDTKEMVIKSGKVPCYLEYCDSTTHEITSQPFADCWQKGGIWLNPEDMETIIEETDHINDRAAAGIRRLY